MDQLSREGSHVDSPGMIKHIISNTKIQQNR